MTAHAQPSVTFAMFSCVSRWTYTLISLVRKSNQASCVVVALVEVALILVENNIARGSLIFHADYFIMSIIAEPLWTNNRWWSADLLHGCRYRWRSMLMNPTANPRLSFFIICSIAMLSGSNLKSFVMNSLDLIRWGLAEGLRKLLERYKADEQQTILTFVPLYIKPAVGFRSFGCCSWSESLSWHIISSFSRGTMLIDVHLSSMVHQFLQWLYICIPTGNEMFLMTWPINANPSIGSRNLRRRQSSISQAGVHKIGIGSLTFSGKVKSNCAQLFKGWITLSSW